MSVTNQRKLYFLRFSQQTKFVDGDREGSVGNPLGEEEQGRENGKAPIFLPAMTLLYPCAVRRLRAGKSSPRALNTTVQLLRVPFLSEK